MKKLFILFLLFADNSLTADFSPTPMTLSIQPQLEYSFDGSSLEIPFTLTGKPAAIWLVVNTHGQAENIVGVKNGYLGWHYVNKIDTTIYISDKFERTPGDNTITWDGEDENGNKAEPGSYDYYLWGYDNKSSDELVCNYVRVGFGFFTKHTQLYEKDNQGLPLSKPLLMGDFFRDDYRQINDDIYRQGTQFKWTIGSNPMDKSLVQTSFCSMYFPELAQSIKDAKGNSQLNPDYITYGGSGFDPKDYNIFYQTSYKNIYSERNYYDPYFSVLKWMFVPGGEANLEQDWGGFNNYTWSNWDLSFRDACIAKDNYIFVTDGYDGDGRPHNNLKCLDYDGNIIFDKNFTEWNMNEHILPFGGRNADIDKIYSRQSNRMLMISTWSCIYQMINPSRLFDNPDDENDMVVFTNSNGDYFMDSGWQDNLQYSWYCVVGHMNTQAFTEIHDTILVKTAASVDVNNFSLIFVRNCGIASFGVSTQDGTGIGYMPFKDDNLDKSCKGGEICDSGSAYDGIYFTRDAYLSWQWIEDPPSTYYMAFDSAHGMITNTSAVEEQNPIQFKVSQNTPNPFNPSTTISFTVPEKGNVSIDIYNITGQKIKTLINGPMSAGEHSVRWDAGGCSAGVYFYKLKSGEFEKTMRMTLVK